MFEDLKFVDRGMPCPVITIIVINLKKTLNAYWWLFTYWCAIQSPTHHLHLSALIHKLCIAYAFSFLSCYSCNSLSNQPFSFFLFQTTLFKKAFFFVLQHISLLVLFLVNKVASLSMYLFKGKNGTPNN